MSDWLVAFSTPAPVALVSDLDDLLVRWETLSGDAFERAIMGGALADRLGLAFAAGYRSALLSLTGEANHAALCVTEEGGGHPRAIQTRLRREGDHAFVTGTKSWATLAGRARTLLVAASVGQTEGRNELRVVRVPVDAEGVELTAMPPTPFTPEVPHFGVALRDVRLPSTAILEGDGYDVWIKPFRTVEDIHVIAAATAHVVSTGRRADWPAPLLAEGLAILSALENLAPRAPLEPGVHLALGGVLSHFTGWLERTRSAWTRADAAVQERWTRDQPLLKIAGRARAARFAKACEQAQLSGE